MCGTPEGDPDLYRWRAGLPDSPGDWLWVQHFGCGCVIASGIAWVHDDDGRYDERIRGGDRPLYLSWQAEPERRPRAGADGRWYIDHWMKVAIPRDED